MSILSHCIIRGIRMSQSVPSDPISHCPWDGLDRMGTSQSFSCSIPYPYCPSHPIVPWDGQNGNAPKRAMQCTLSLLSIPSHCTMGRNGHTVGIPWCPMHNTPNPKCPSHLTVPWEVMDTLWESQDVPCTIPPIPSVHPIPLYCGK